MKKNRYTGSRQALCRSLAAFTAVLLLFTMGMHLPARATQAPDVPAQGAQEKIDRTANSKGDESSSGEGTPQDKAPDSEYDAREEGSEDPRQDGADDPDEDPKGDARDPQDDDRVFEEIQVQYKTANPSGDDADPENQDGDGDEGENEGEDAEPKDQMSGDVDSSAALTEQFDLQWDGDEQQPEGEDENEEETEQHEGEGEDEKAPNYEYEYTLTTMEPVALSAILEQTGLPLALEEIEELGVVGVPEETEGLIAIVPSDGDYILSPLERFEALELSLSAGEALYILRLIQRIEPEPEGEVLDGQTAEPVQDPVKLSFIQKPRYGHAGVAMQATVRVEGGEGPYSIVSEGAQTLLDAAGEAEVSAIPQDGGDYTWHVTVTDAQGGEASAEAVVPVSDDAQNEPNALPELTEQMRTAEKLVAIARSQVGYHECRTNFVIDENDIRQGWSWYGARNHAAYAQWCAIFVDYCLDMADVNETQLLRAANCHRWIESLADGLYVDDEDSYAPVPGDIVFFHHNRVGSSNEPNYPNHVGIVVELTETGFITVEGNSGNAVREHTYLLNDRSIVGYIPLNAVTGEGQREYREIEARVDGRIIRVAGNLPADAEVQAVLVPLESAQAVLDAQAAEDAPAPVALFAYDISILSGGVKFQPEDFGESVTVTFVDEALEGDVSLLHVKTDVTDGEGGLDEAALDAVADAVAAEDVETETQSAEADAQSEVSFEVDSFSLMIAYRNATPHKVTYVFNWDPNEPENAPTPPTDDYTYSENEDVSVISVGPFEGYTFSGWKKGDEGVKATFTMPDEDVTLTGTWTINKHKITYAFDGNKPDAISLPPAEEDIPFRTEKSVVEF